MRKNSLILIVVLATSCVMVAQQQSSSSLSSSTLPTGQTEREQRILGVVDQMVKAHQTYLSVPVQDGKALRLLTEATAAKNVLEIGTSTGYSGLWLCLALQRTGGHLTTFEIDHQRASAAREHFKEAGVDQIVTIVEGDAHQGVVKLKGPIDLVFIDADKNGYVDYLNKVRPIVRPGGLILAHNVDMVPDYVKAVTDSTELETIFYMEGGGLGVTLKKR
jgi:caffeoyl-CoA O-methyltransferase